MFTRLMTPASFTAQFQVTLSSKRKRDMRGDSAFLQYSKTNIKVMRVALKIFICNHYAFESTPIINKNNDTFDIFIKYLIKKSAYDRITSQRASELKVKDFEKRNTKDR